MRNDLLKTLSEEQIARVKACKNPEEIMSLAKQEGVELSEEQLAAVSGGGCFSTNKCPKCGATKFQKITRYVGPGGGVEVTIYKCEKCGEEWS